ncbi:MAG: hypothetical protein R3D44_00915 [Hyphomicrobiaceae bacterium]
MTETYWLSDDGLVPNNDQLPAVVYRAALPVGADAETDIIRHFADNGWANAWVNGIYPFHHYHATVHEVLGIARGQAIAQLGGASGPTLHLSAGDAVIIPAGTGHCRLGQSSDLSVVGAYPEGAGWDLVRATSEARLAALPVIALVPVPRLDPVLGGSFTRYPARRHSGSNAPPAPPEA